MPHLRLIAVMFVTIGLSCSTARAQLLQERLVPPQRFSIPSLPMTEQPAARQPAGADKLSAHLWTLPVGAFSGAPTSLSHEQLPVDWRRPVLDVPTLASESDPTRPASPRQPVAPSAFALAADPLQPHTLDRFSLTAELPIRANDNATAAVAHALLTLAVPLAAPNAAPLLRLTIADPFEHLRAIRLATPPADSDAPDAAREIPPRPQLAAEAPKK